MKRRRPRKGKKKFKSWLGLLCLSAVAAAASTQFLELPRLLQGWPVGVGISWVVAGIYFLTGRG